MVISLTAHLMASPSKTKREQSNNTHKSPSLLYLKQYLHYAAFRSVQSTLIEAIDNGFFNHDQYEHQI